MSIYAATATRVLARIRAKGGPVSFPSGAAPVYDGATDTYSPDTRTVATGRAVQDNSDPDMLRSLSLIGIDNVTLLVAARGFVNSAGVAISFAPAWNAPMTWAGKTYTVKWIDPLAPDGTPEGTILWTIVGAA